MGKRKSSLEGVGMNQDFCLDPHYVCNWRHWIGGQPAIKTTD
jgi:hypothetical protein